MQSIKSIETNETNRIKINEMKSDQYDTIRQKNSNQFKIY